MVERIDPMARIAALVGGQSAPPPTTAPASEPVMIERKCSCGATTTWATNVMPPEQCVGCHRPWNAPPAQPDPAVGGESAPAPKRGRPKRTVEQPKTEEQPQTGEPTSTTKEVVEARVKELIAKLQLNDLQPKQVGTGVIFSLGFTRWVEREGERVPQTYYMLPTDSPSSFRELYEAVHNADRTVAMDTALVSGLSAELADIAYRGEIEASLWDGKRGRISVMRGAKVRVGAKVSKRGRLLFSVLGVEP